MTNASKSSSRVDVARHKASRCSDQTQAAAERRRLQREWSRLSAPPDVRHRRREARRWLDEEAVRITNPPVSERHPGERLFDSMAERRAVADALRSALRRDDPELYRAVERLEFEDFTRDMGITFEEWKRRSAHRSARVSKVRAEMQRAGLL
jgi:hypothetical protein